MLTGVSVRLAFLKKFRSRKIEMDACLSRATFRLEITIYLSHELQLEVGRNKPELPNYQTSTRVIKTHCLLIVGKVRSLNAPSKILVDGTAR